MALLFSLITLELYSIICLVSFSIFEVVSSHSEAILSIISCNSCLLLSIVDSPFSNTPVINSSTLSCSVSNAVFNVLLRSMKSLMFKNGVIARFSGTTRQWNQHSGVILIVSAKVCIKTSSPTSSRIMFSI